MKPSPSKFAKVAGKKRGREEAAAAATGAAPQMLLTPKFGKESDLWVQLDEEFVRRKEGLSRCNRQKNPRSAICFRSAREQLS
jgi:hypothetical protein